MSLKDLQILFSRMTLGEIAIEEIERIHSRADMLALGLSLTDKELKLLGAIDWDIARRGISAHLGIARTLTRVSVLRDDQSGKLISVQYPFPNPKLRRSKNGKRKAKVSKGSQDQSKGRRA